MSTSRCKLNANDKTCVPKLGDHWSPVGVSTVQRPSPSSGERVNAPLIELYFCLFILSDYPNGSVRNTVSSWWNDFSPLCHIWRDKICCFQWIQKEKTQAPDWSTNLELPIHFCCDKVGQRLGEENLIGAKNKACLEYVTRTRCIQKTEQEIFAEKETKQIPRYVRNWKCILVKGQWKHWNIEILTIE